jgi:hypothetical protein
MARSLPVLKPLARQKQIRLGIGIEIVAIIWMVIEATVALTTGIITRSISLEGFGIDSIIELIAGGILLWRLLIESRGNAPEQVEHAERRAAWVTAIGLFALAGYIVVDSIWTFSQQIHPTTSWLSQTDRQCSAQS